MKSATKITTLALAAAVLAAFGAGAAAPASKPNIIFILADDLGIGSVSCYGADHFKTPNVDSLARGGLRFENCYASPLCGPSRALLMTGRYAYHTGMTSNQTGPRLKPANEIMMPRVLKPAGYVTAQCGKWAQLPLQPGDWGFDEYLRFQGSGKYWNTQPGAKFYTLNGKEVRLRDGEYLPDRMQAFVVDFIRRHKDQPFYVYYSMSHVHAQILPTPDTAPGTKEPFKLYQDNVTYMDKLVGQLLAELDHLKLRQNTLILFAGDNGTARPWYQRCTINGGKDLSGHKATMLECGALVPCIANWPARIAGGQVTHGLINICDFYPTLAAVAGAKLPAGLVVDGRDFTPQLLGESQAWPRDWIFVELGRRWYDRDRAWKLNEVGNLFDMHGAPYTEPLVPADTQDPDAIAARKRLEGVLKELNPAGGIMDPRQGPGAAGRKKKGKMRAAREGLPIAKAGAMDNPGNQNEDNE
jgi:arylsulfatase A